MMIQIAVWKIRDAQNREGVSKITGVKTDVDVVQRTGCRETDGDRCNIHGRRTNGEDLGI